MKTEITKNGEQGVFDFDAKPEFYESEEEYLADVIQAKRPPRPILREWLKAKAAFGHYDAAGWVQDLALYFDPQWDVGTGKVGPFRFFLSPPPSYRRHPISKELQPFHCREIPAPEGWNIPTVYNSLLAVGIRLHQGYHPCKGREFPFRTGDISSKQRRRDRKTFSRFGYADRTARTGKLRMVEGVRYQPAGFVWEEA